ncbi:MAG: hypothetical protein J6N78_00410 [Clostridia bacterium]|nr:hypothetical protein [Clostridia bacterium]
MEINKIKLALKFREIVPSVDTNYLIRTDVELKYKHQAQKSVISHQDDIEEAVKHLKEITKEEYEQLEGTNSSDPVSKEELEQEVNDNILQGKNKIKHIKKAVKQEEETVLPEGHYFDEYGYEITPIPETPESNEDMMMEEEMVMREEMEDL